MFQGSKIREITQEAWQSEHSTTTTNCERQCTENRRIPTDYLMPESSQNPTSHKATTIKTLARRAQLVCDTLDSVRDENKYLNTRLTEHKRTTRNDEANNHTSHLTMKMTSASAQFVETSVTNSSFFFFRTTFMCTITQYELLILLG